MKTSTWCRALLGALAAGLLAGCGNGAQTPIGTLTRSSGFAPRRMLELQAEGKIPGPFPRAVLQQELKEIEGHPRPRIEAHGNASSVAIWATNAEFNYLLGLSANGKKTIAAIDLQPQDCYNPLSVKIDGSHNVWVSCEYNFLGTGGEILIYSSAGKLRQTYAWSPCPPSYYYCLTNGYDDGRDAKGNVFAAVSFYTYGNPSGSASGAGFEWWNHKTPSAPPSLIGSGAYCAPVCTVYFMDVDNAGDIWFTYFGTQNSVNGYGLAEVTHPTTNPKVVPIIAPGAYQFADGVYVSDRGKTLTVTDTGTRKLYQYHLPIAPGAAPFNILGPTPLTRIHAGAPYSGSFNKDESLIVEGDESGWLDIGTVATNTWKRAWRNPNFSLGLGGAAYTPSDKKEAL